MLTNLFISFRIIPLTFRKNPMLKLLPLYDIKLENIIYGNQ